MRKVTNKGNLPGHVGIFAKELEGQLAGQEESEFWEMSSITEIENKAVELGFELYPTVDATTERAYLVGFDAEEPVHIVTVHSYAKLKMYFIEITTEELRNWDRKIRNDRQDQMDDMRSRQKRNAKNKTDFLKKFNIITDGGDDDKSGI